MRIILQYQLDVKLYINEIFISIKPYQYVDFQFQ